MTAAEFLLVVVGVAAAVDYASSLEAAQPVGTPRFCSIQGERCYSYDQKDQYGPTKWGHVCQTKHCFAGSNQSPIFINPKKVKKVCDKNNKLRYAKKPTVKGHIINQGLVAEVKGIKGAYLSGVPGFEERFHLIQLHFHFRGGPGNWGTEHKVGHKDYDAEMHLVHIREGIDLEKATSTKSGFAVVGVFLSTREGNPNKELDKILDNVGQIRKYRLLHCQHVTKQNTSTCPKVHHGCVHNDCQEVDVEFSPDRLLPTNRDFFYYYGSLTTPPLTEAVSWNVMAHPIKISPYQLNLLQDLDSWTKGVKVTEAGNVRPMQRLNGRKVYFHSCKKSCSPCETIRAYRYISRILEPVS